MQQLSTDSEEEEGDMRTWKITSIVMALVVMAWGCSMAESPVFQPKPLDNMMEVPAPQESQKLDAEVTAFLRNTYAIASARYYKVPGEIPWIAVSKSVQNQMAEKSIPRKIFDWYEPGLDFVEVYPQGKTGAAFAVAMLKGTQSGGGALVGFYVLTAAKNK
jgi:hypothetical protein